MGETLEVVMYLLSSHRATLVFERGDLNVRETAAASNRALSCYLQQTPCETWLSPGSTSISFCWFLLTQDARLILQICAKVSGPAMRRPLVKPVV